MQSLNVISYLQEIAAALSVASFAYLLSKNRQARGAITSVVNSILGVFKGRSHLEDKLVLLMISALFFISLFTTYSGMQGLLEGAAEELDFISSLIAILLSLVIQLMILLSASSLFSKKGLLNKLFNVFVYVVCVSFSAFFAFTFYFSAISFEQVYQYEFEIFSDNAVTSVDEALELHNSLYKDMSTLEVYTRAKAEDELRFGGTCIYPDGRSHYHQGGEGPIYSLWNNESKFLALHLNLVGDEIKNLESIQSQLLNTFEDDSIDIKSKTFEIYRIVKSYDNNRPQMMHSTISNYLKRARTKRLENDSRVYCPDPIFQSLSERIIGHRVVRIDQNARGLFKFEPSSYKTQMQVAARSLRQLDSHRDNSIIIAPLLIAILVDLLILALLLMTSNPSMMVKRD